MKVILASSSPFRQNLMAKLQIPFQAISPEVNEDNWKQDFDNNPEWLASELAYQKAKSIFEKFPNELIIGCDQVCYLDNRIVSKSYDNDQAFDQLSSLQGKSHQLFTAYSLLSPQGRIDHCNITTLQMKSLSSQQIQQYIEKDSPLFCAGSYKLESLGISLFDKIDTDDSTAVIGLPLIQLVKDLNKLGISIL